ASFAITGGPDAALIHIPSLHDALPISAKDFETDPHSYAVQVTASDGLNTAVQSIAVTLTDVNDNAPVSTSSATLDVAENSVAVDIVIAHDCTTVALSARMQITAGADAA